MSQFLSSSKSLSVPMLKCGETWVGLLYGKAFEIPGFYYDVMLMKTKPTVLIRSREKKILSLHTEHFTINWQERLLRRFINTFIITSQRGNSMSYTGRVSATIAECSRWVRSTVKFQFPCDCQKFLKKKNQDATKNTKMEQQIWLFYDKRAQQRKYYNTIVFTDVANSNSDG